MDIPIVGPPPIEPTGRTGHGGAHGQAKMPQPHMPAGRTDTVHISDAARLAAQKAAQKAEDDAKSRVTRDGARKRERPYGASDPHEPGEPAKGDDAPHHDTPQRDWSD